jgi:hypothetical protein
MEERKYVRVAYSVSYSLQGDAEGSYNMMWIVLDGNVTILQLTPYHCKLNSAELVWAQVKHYIAINNVTFKTA